MTEETVETFLPEGRVYSS